MIEGWILVGEIESGEDQSFVLFVITENNAVWVCKSGLIPIARLDADHWCAKIIVQSDNLEEFEGSLGFTISHCGGALLQDNPAFVRRRSVPPRLKLA